MENKKSFLLFCDIIETVSKLPNEEAGKLFKHILEYVNDKDPIIENNLLLEIAFEPIKQSLKRNLQQWEKERKQRSEAGKAGMEARWKKDNTVKNVITEDNTVINTITNITDSVSNSNNVNDNVNGNRKGNENPKKINNIEDRKLKFALTLQPYLEKYGRQMLNDFVRYWSEPNKSNTKFKQEMEKTWDLERRLDTWASKDWGKKEKKEDDKQFKING